MKDKIKGLLKNVIYRLPPYYRSYIPGYFLGREYRNFLKEIEMVEKLSAEKQVEYQRKRLNIVLEVAKKNEYYSKVLKKNFEEIPFLERKIIQQENLLTTNDNKKIIRTHTSGSTGQPLTVCRITKENERESANIDFLLKKAGINIYKRVKYLNLRDNKKEAFQKIGDLYYIPPSYIKAENINDIVKGILKINPHVIHVHPSIINNLVNLLKNKNIKLKLSNLKVILVSSERFDDIMKENIYQYFKCNILDYYSNEENSICGYRIYPVMSYMKFPRYYSYVEIIDGELVSTSLNSLVMPLIRYKTGDKVKEDNLEKIKYIEGRTNEYLIDCSGNKVPLENFSTYYYENVYLYQFLDIGNGNIEFRVQVLPNKVLNEEKILSTLNTINKNFNYIVRQVNEIERINNKHKMIVRFKDIRF